MASGTERSLCHHLVPVPSLPPPSQVLLSQVLAVEPSFRNLFIVKGLYLCPLNPLYTTANSGSAECLGTKIVLRRVLSICVPTRCGRTQALPSEAEPRGKKLPLQLGQLPVDGTGGWGPEASPKPHGCWVRAHSVQCSTGPIRETYNRPV